MGLQGLLVTPSGKHGGCRFEYYHTTQDGSFHTLMLSEAMQHCGVETVTLPHTQESLQLAQQMNLPDGYAAYQCGDCLHEIYNLSGKAYTQRKLSSSLSSLS